MGKYWHPKIDHVWVLNDGFKHDTMLFAQNYHG